MPVKIVTNSSSDIPQEIVDDLGITVIPEYVIFGNQCYKDRIDISEDEFYNKLVRENVQPTTSCPTPQDFIKVYDELGQEADGIVSIHISSKLSGTTNSALQAKNQTRAQCPIAVIDSKSVSMALGMAVILAAKMAKNGQSFQEIVDFTNDVFGRIHVLVMFDTLKYLARGGRIGRAKSLVGSLLSIKPLLTIKDGEFSPVAQVRSSTKAKEKLLEFVAGFPVIEDLYAVYSTDKNEAVELLKRIPNFPTEQIILARLGPVVGTHTGPGLLALGVRTRT
ncbi:MAG: DegV family protein [Dehalococcoidia bacterium]|nr:DegV family protein [Dehalococcoidia bacterium]